MFQRLIYSTEFCRGKGISPVRKKGMIVDVLTKDLNCPLQIDIPEDGNPCLEIDGRASVVAFGKPSDAKTVGDYADRFVNHILKAGRRFDRIDVAVDLYKNTGTSIKDGTREKRKKKKYCSIIRPVESRAVPMPSNWNDFLALSKDKSDFVAFLSEELVRAAPSGKTVVVAGSSEMEVKPAILKLMSACLDPITRMTRCPISRDTQRRHHGMYFWTTMSYCKRLGSLRTCQRKGSACQKPLYVEFTRFHITPATKAVCTFPANANHQRGLTTPYK